MHLKNLNIFFILTLSLVASIVVADSWPPAERALYKSSDYKVRLIVVPSVFKDRGIASKCQLQLEQTKNGEVTVFWKRDCINSYAPHTALVSNHAKYAITFDNWGSLGSGKDTVVIYGPKGTLVKSFSLSDFLSKDEILKLPRSVSSIYWGGEHYIDPDGELLTLKATTSGNLVMPWEKSAKLKFKSIKIRLADGKILSNDFQRKYA
jgi:hypothetical protein